MHSALYTQAANCHTVHLHHYYFSKFWKKVDLCLSAYRVDKKNRFGKNKGFGKRYKKDKFDILDKEIERYGS